ncbi:acyltransferase domain-containing protein [Saccharomonospora sp. NPDC046836]|uniref:acyltransferase domain-containing protein n=1 Tax=Saccharomonospora sp. NPDC046836 TaxID=3156921 RepID=UPI0034053B16
MSPLLLDHAAPSAEELVAHDPARSHLAIFTCSMAAHHILTQAGRHAADVLVGHSFGEIAALTAAGALTVEGGARVVAERDTAFEQCLPQPGGMLSVELSEPRTRHLLAALGCWRVEIAAVNAPTQTVVSGLHDDLAHVESVASAAGWGCRRVRAPYPFHHPMLLPVAEQFAKALAGIPFAPPRTRVYSPVAQVYYRPDDDLRAAVTAHLSQPVWFADAVRALHAEGVHIWVECGARSILTDLAARTIPGLAVWAPLRHRASAVSPLDAAAEEATHGDTSPIRPTTQPTAPQPQPRATPALDTNGHHLPVPAQPPVSEQQAAAVSLPPRDELVETLRREYAQALDYPEDVFTDDADLEADLGVDSLKQSEMFARLRRRYSLPAPGAGTRLSVYRTLPSVADGLLELAARDSVAAG